MTRRPPYLLALLAALLVLTGYAITLAPTVTFWDAGEFIAASRTLGIPHPPGTPLFVMIGHVWAALLPIREYAVRTNLLSATLSALGAGFLFLVVHDGLQRMTADEAPGWRLLITLGGSFAATLAAAFGFTAWQNSNETEVYAAATFTIAMVCWLCLRWRDARGTPRAPHLLLLILYLGGISIGNHLLALLVGPAVVVYLASILVDSPAVTAEAQQAEWARVAVVAGTWALLIGGGLGSTPLTALGGACYLIALVLALRARTLTFALIALVVAGLGITSYLFLYIRAGQHPILNEAQPDHWDSLLAVIRRAQYPVRTPLDDPTVPHGRDNPGRNPTIMGLQLLNYIQYFDWQWGNGITRVIQIGAASIPARSLLSILFAALGVHGLFTQRQADRSAWRLLFMLWLVTGLGLVVYMNFKPGFSLGFKSYPDFNQHEVRERDYFFVVSYMVWGLWAGIGMTSSLRKLGRWWRLSPALAGIPLGVLALVPFAANFQAATRRHGADATLAADFAYNLLNSMPPYGVLFTYGDNDTFPLWWAQEVNGIRQDVQVICLALAETDWYKRQLRDLPVRPFDGASAPAIWRGTRPERPSWPLHSLTDAQIQQAEGRLLPEDVAVRLGPVTDTLRKGTALYSRDFLVLRILQENLGRRPIAWSMTTGPGYYGLERYLLQQGMVISLQTTAVDTTRSDLSTRRILGVPLDVPTTDRLAWETYRFAKLLERGSRGLEPTSATASNNLSVPFAQLAFAYEDRGDRERAMRNANRAGLLSSNPGFQAALQHLLEAPVPDSGKQPAPFK